MENENSKESSYIIPGKHKKQITDERLEVFEQILTAVGINKNIVNIVSSYLYSWYLQPVIDYMKEKEFVKERLRTQYNLHLHRDVYSTFLKLMEYPFDVMCPETNLLQFVKTIPIFSPNIKYVWCKTNWEIKEPLVYNGIQVRHRKEQGEHNIKLNGEWITTLDIILNAWEKSSPFRPYKYVIIVNKISYDTNKDTGAVNENIICLEMQLQHSD